MIFFFLYDVLILTFVIRELRYLYLQQGMKKNCFIKISLFISEVQ